MEIIGYDGLENMPLKDGQVRSVQIKDPDKPDTISNYCIGYKFIGGDPTDLSNWNYDHANYHEDDGKGSEIPMRDMSRRELDEKLEAMGVKLEEILKIYIEKIT